MEDSLDSICVLLIIFACIASFSYLSIRVSPLSSIMLDFLHVLYLVSWGSHFVSALVFLISLYCTKNKIHTTVSLEDVVSMVTPVL